MAANGDAMEIEEQAATSNGSNGNHENEDEGMASLKIPITSTAEMSEELYIEVFPEEVLETPSSQMLQVLKDEAAPLSTWADAALLYMQTKQKSRDAATLLQAACDRTGGDRKDRVRLLASAGIAHLTQAQQSNAVVPSRPGTTDPKEELRGLADNKFTHASKVDTLFPMTWMGRGMLNLSIGRYEQAKFFFDTTLSECGQVLPALLGMAAVMYGEQDYKGAQDMYAKAMKLYPTKSGAATRVGFGLASYRLGQVDRAKASFARALDIDRENVDAMVGSAVLDMSSLDETSREFNALMEKAIKMMSMANLLDHSNAMVQNHLANHYFWKWTPLPGSVEATEGSVVVQASQPIPLEPGESIRIGTSFESQVVEDANAEEEADTTKFRMKHPWKSPNIKGVKVWKKDYDRVIALAKGAYNSTTVQDIQAESLFFLARVHHVREDFENAHRFYERACKLSPSLSPARFGLAQTLIAQEEYQQAAAHLQLVLGTSSTATDALAAVGLLEVKGTKNYTEGLTHLRKAVDLDPLNPSLILLEALALQQQENNYSRALERYKKAIQLMQRQNKKIDAEVFTNVGVLCHETRQYDESLIMYSEALKSLHENDIGNPTMENKGVDGGRIRHPENSMFYGYLDTDLELEYPAGSDDGLSELKIKDSKGKEVSTLPISVGDHVRLEKENFESEVKEIKSDEDGGISVVLRDVLKVIMDDDKENKEVDESTPAPPKESTFFVLQVKRENKLLEEPKAMTIAFNIARLHEIVGRTLAAVEIHKAIVKRNPAYVNSYLRLACIAIDCGALKECAGWLKIAAETAPGNPEVLTLIGNLHLSLCDWPPAQQVFDGLLAKKVPNVEAYAMLSLGNIYFANLKVAPKRYGKHLQYAADYYKRILTKDNSNAYAANGIGTILAEKGELFKAKEVFNRVRQVSDDSIADAHLNLGHVYLAQKRHPEALQMYQSYMKRTEDGTAPISSKSRVDDMVDVLMYTAFAYFDWARQTELFDNAKAAPADQRYKKAMENLELAISKNTSKHVVLTYNLCMTKLQAANCVLRKLSRNIRRTAKEVEDALNGLQESLTTVEEILQNKQDQKMKVPIATSMLNDFLTHCKSNIESAKSHMEDERKREEEANEMRQLQLIASESQRKEHEIREALQKSETVKKQEERDRRARLAMRKVEDLRQGWEQEKVAQQAAAEKKSSKGGRNPTVPDDPDDLFPDDDDKGARPDTAGLFDDSSDDEGEAPKTSGDGGEGSDKEKPADDKDAAANTTEKDLFGESSDDDSDEELVPSGQKRELANGDGGEDADEASAKRPKLSQDDD